jgi:mycothiol synthase
MLDVTVRRPVARADAGLLRRLAQRAEAHDRHPAVGDAVWRDVARPSPVSAIAVASRDGVPVGALHVGAPEKASDSTLTMALVVDPRHRGEDVERRLVESVLDDPEVRSRPVLLWIFGADASTDEFARAVGLEPERELRQLRVALPLPLAAGWPPDVEVRLFRVGRDESAWLAVNNRAFALDPDQSQWTLATLQRREQESWFDPAGFLLAWRRQTLAGFCWTRLHAASPPHEPETLGEIYVIGVDPDHQGIGLGRALVLGGLALTHEQGATTGMLFVDARNTTAIALYEGLGFITKRIDRAYAREAS